MGAHSVSFRYHPDPEATGSATGAQQACKLCGGENELAYAGPIYGNQPDGPVCLSCIADGSASTALGASNFPASFTDVGGPECDGIPDSILEEIARRTPGFIGWQQEHWLYHCGDGAAYLGRIEFDDLATYPDARKCLLDEALGYGLSPEQAEESLRNMQPDGNATAYLFRCLHCDAHLAYSDLS